MQNIPGATNVKQHLLVSTISGTSGSSGISDTVGNSRIIATMTSQEMETLSEGLTRLHVSSEVPSSDPIPPIKQPGLVSKILAGLFEKDATAQSGVIKTGDTGGQHVTQPGLGLEEMTAKDALHQTCSKESNDSDVCRICQLSAVESGHYTHTPFNQGGICRGDRGNVPQWLVETLFFLNFSSICIFIPPLVFTTNTTLRSIIIKIYIYVMNIVLYKLFCPNQHLIDRATLSRLNMLSPDHRIPFTKIMQHQRWELPSGRIKVR